MNVFLLTAGSRGDVQPFVALANELQRGGHTVTLAAPADAERLVRCRAVPFVSLGIDYQALSEGEQTRGAVLGNPAAILHALSQVKERMRAMFERAWEASQGADVVVFHPKALAGLHIAEALSIPCFIAAPTPLLVPTREFPAPVGALPNWRTLNRATYLLSRMATLPFHGIINRWRQDDLGLPPLSRSSSPFASRGEPLPVLYAFSETLVPRAPDWPEYVHVTGFWLQSDELTEYTPPDSVRAFVEAGAPPVYVGFGSMTGANPEPTTRVVLEAIHRAEVRAVLSPGWGGLQPSDVHEDVLVVGSVSHDWLFPRCSAVVHHGGAGTTATGLRAGCPTVICPFFGDQPFWGERVHVTGAGPEPVPQSRLRADRLASAIRTAVHDPRMRERAEQLGTAIRAEDGAGNAARLIAKAAS